MESSNVRNAHRKEIVDGLVILIEQLEPFLDSFGRVYCRMPHAEKEKQAVQPLRGRQVRSLLAYRFHREKDEYPGRERISDAIEFVEGRLLENRRAPAIPGRGHFWGLRPNPSGCFVKLQPEQMSLI